MIVELYIYTEEHDKYEDMGMSMPEPETVEFIFDETKVSALYRPDVHTMILLIDGESFPCVFNPEIYEKLWDSLM